MMRLFILVALFIGVLIADRAEAVDIFPQPRTHNNFADRPIITGCWIEEHYFDSFTGGPVPYCRGHLKYTPGALDCYYATEQVCSVFWPAQNQWTQSRNLLPPTLIECPDAPKPPFCP